mgnify:CR=1 FL=1
MRRSIQELKDKHKGEDVLILGCGPSLNDFSEDQLQEIAKNKVALCIKASIEKLKNF